MAPKFQFLCGLNVVFSVLLALLSSVTMGPGSDTQKPPLMLGLYDQKPLGWYDDTSGYQGLAYDHLMYLANYAVPSADTEIYFGNTERLVYGLLVGEVDLLISAGNSELEQKTINLGHLSTMRIELWRLKDENNKPVKNPYQGTMAAHEYYRHLPQLKNSQFYSVKDHKHLIQLLKAGRVDGALATATELCFYASELNFKPSDFERFFVQPLEIFVYGRRSEMFLSNLQSWTAAVADLKDQQVNLAELYCE